MEKQKQLTTQIQRYRESKRLGKIVLLTHQDSYGNITAAVEQTIHDPFTGEEKVMVAAPISVESLDATIERVKTTLQKGNPETPDDIGIESLILNRDNSKKQAEMYEKKISDREKQFAEEIANLEAMRDDVKAALEKAQKEQESQAKAVATDVEKLVAKEAAKK